MYLFVGLEAASLSSPKTPQGHSLFLMARKPPRLLFSLRNCAAINNRILDQAIHRQGIRYKLALESNLAGRVKTSCPGGDSIQEASALR